MSSKENGGGTSASGSSFYVQGGEEAVDGVAWVTVDGGGRSGAPHARTAVQDNPWWEVDLGSEHAISSVEIWGALALNREAPYPPIFRDEPLVPLVVSFLDSEGVEVLRTDVGEDRAQEAWLVVAGPQLLAATVRCVRIVALGARRRLALLEVRVWAHGAWNCSVHCERGHCEMEKGIGEVCDCDPDWAGHDCSTPVRIATRHAPPSLSSRGGWDESAALEARALLARTQFPRVCPPAGVAERFGFWDVGLAGTLNYISGLLGSDARFSYFFQYPFLLAWYSGLVEFQIFCGWCSAYSWASFGKVLLWLVECRFNSTRISPSFTRTVLLELLRVYSRLGPTARLAPARVQFHFSYLIRQWNTSS